MSNGLISRVDTGYTFHCLSYWSFQELQGRILNCVLLLYVCVNINPHIPATKIIFVFMDQESVHQMTSLALICVTAVVARTPAADRMFLSSALLLMLRTKLFCLMKLQNTLGCSLLGWAGAKSCAFVTWETWSDHSDSQRRDEIEFKVLAHPTRKRVSDAAGLQRYCYIVR